MPPPILLSAKAAASLLQFSDPYLQVTQYLVYRRGSARPRSLEEIDGDLLIVKGSSHSEQLKHWAKQYPHLSWREDSNSEMSELLRMVHDREIDYTVVDSLAYLVSRHIYPQVRRAIDISDPQSVAWAFPRHGDGTLLAAANRFLSDYSASGELTALKNDLLEQADNFSVAGSQRFGELVNSRLPIMSRCLRWPRSSLVSTGICWPPWPIKNRTGIRKPARPPGCAA